MAHHTKIGLALIAFLSLIKCHNLSKGTRMEIVAHRGASGLYPENTMLAFRKALELNVDWVEMDFQLSKDLEVVAFHDETLEKVSRGSETIAQLDLAELKTIDVGSWKNALYHGEGIPTLQEVLAVLPAEKGLFLELKSSEPMLANRVVEILEQKAFQGRKVRVISFHYELLEALKKRMPFIPCYYVIGTNHVETKESHVVDRAGLSLLIERALQNRIEGIDFEYSSLLTKENIELVQQNGLLTAAWVSSSEDTKENFQQAKALGLDAYTTNFPSYNKQ